jgi:hypothetical protein
MPGLFLFKVTDWLSALAVSAPMLETTEYDNDGSDRKHHPHLSHHKDVM